MSNKNLLIVTPYFPYPIHSGGAQAQFHMIDALRKEFRISFAFIAPRRREHEKALQERWEDVTFYPFRHANPSWMFKRAKSLLKTFHCWHDRGRHLLHPALVHSFEEPVDYRFVDFLQEIVEKESIGIVQFEFAEYLNLAYAFPNVKKVFVHHEIHFVRNARFLKDTPLPAHDAYQFNMLKRQELCALNACDAIIALTETDRRILQEEHVATPIFVSPAVIPSPYETLPAEFDFERRIVFLGGDGHKPNYEGIMWFLQNVWEEVSRSVPDIRLQVVGKWRTKHRKSIKARYANVEMLGYVEDIAPYLRNAIMIVPILTGSGMRMKIIDAANHGTPFVTTRVGVEGLDFTDGEECFIVDDEQRFAERLTELINSPATQASFRANAFGKISSMYPTRELVETRARVYRQLL